MSLSGGRKIKSRISWLHSCLYCTPNLSEKPSDIGKNSHNTLLKLSSLFQSIHIYLPSFSDLFQQLKLSSEYHSDYGLIQYSQPSILFLPILLCNNDTQYHVLLLQHVPQYLLIITEWKLGTFLYTYQTDFQKHTTSYNTLYTCIHDWTLLLPKSCLPLDNNSILHTLSFILYSDTTFSCVILPTLNHMKH